MQGSLRVGGWSALQVGYPMLICFHKRGVGHIEGQLRDLGIIYGAIAIQAINDNNRGRPIKPEARYRGLPLQ